MRQGFIHLLRVQAEPRPQTGLFDESSKPIEVLSAAFLSKPTATVRRGTQWHIGNSEDRTDYIVFLLGRTHNVQMSQFDPESRNFIQYEDSDSPFTVGIFDKTNQTCGVLRKTGVSLSALEVAKKIEVLLNETEFPSRAGRIVKVEPIRDPNPFLKKINEAYQVKRFTFYFSPPNAADVDRLIQKPAENYAKDIGGTEGEISVWGQALDKGLLTSMAKATAALGKRASAYLIPKKGKAGTTSHLAGDTASEPLDNVDQSSLSLSMLEAMRRLYYRIRSEEWHG